MSLATMPRNESTESEASEFELVLGNKQLLSIFFIVVVLLGVFFTMGYVVGRNSTPVEANRRVEPYDRQDAPSAVPMAKREPPAITAEQPASPAEEERATSTGSTPSQATQRPAEGSAVTVTQPQEGHTYLQVVAVAKPEAEVLAEVLAKKGFRAFVAPGPNDKLFRVLVGPAADINDVGKLKSDLEAAGMKPIVKKY